MLGQLVHAVGDPMILILSVIRSDKMGHGALSRLQPKRISCQAIKAAQGKGGFAVIINGARLFFSGEITVQHMVIFPCFLVQHSQNALAQRLADLLILFVSKDLHIFRQRYNSHAAASQLDFVRFFLIEISSPLLVINHRFQHKINGLPDLFRQRLIRRQTIAAD